MSTGPKWHGHGKTRIGTWCGRGVSKPLPSYMLTTANLRKVTCKVCRLAYANNKKARRRA